MTDGPGRARIARGGHPGLVTAVLALVGVNVAFMQTLVLPLQSELPDLLDANQDDTTWVVTATLLSAAVVTPIAGRLGDMFGKRRVILALLAGLVAGSVVAALSTSLGPLIVGRALQGVALGVIPLGIAILRDVVPPQRLGTSVALVSATLGIGGALGMPLSAILSEGPDWHSIFWLSTGLGIVSIVLVLLAVPESVLRTAGRFDALGAILFALALTGILLAISKGNDWGWTSPVTLVCGLGGIAILLGWGIFELRVRDPLVDLRVAARPAVLFTNLASVAMGFALFSNSVAMPQLLELPTGTGVGLGQTLLVSGLVLMTSGLAMMVISPISGRLIRRFGGRPLLVTGALVLLGSYLYLLLFSSEVWQIVVVSILFGVGIGFGYAAMPTLIMQAVPSTETAAANSLNTLMRSLGTTIAAAVVGAVLSGFVAPFEGGFATTAEGFRWAFVLGAVAALASAILALLVPKTTVHYPEHPALPTSR